MGGECEKGEEDMTTHFFLGANSGSGYRSLFLELAEEAKEELVVLKGGPGGEVPVFLERLGAALSGRSKDSVILARSHGSLFSGAAAIAYHCSGCKKIVIDYEQESDANEDAATGFMRL